VAPGGAVHGLRRGEFLQLRRRRRGRGAWPAARGGARVQLLGTERKKAREFRLSRWAAGSVGLSES
jgi:hypothetical protein